MEPPVQKMLPISELLATNELDGWRVAEVLNRGGWANGDVYLIERGDEQWVLKTYAERSGWLRSTLGRWLIAREKRVYERLTDLPGVAPCLEIRSPYALVVRAVAGEPISFKIRPENVGEISARLETIVHAMHARGVFHLDLRNRGNVLVDDFGQPTVLDFASSAVFRPGGLLHRLIGPILRAWDARGLSKWSSAQAAQQRP